MKFSMPTAFLSSAVQAIIPPSSETQGQTVQDSGAREGRKGQKGEAKSEAKPDFSSPKFFCPFRPSLAPLSALRSPRRHSGKMSTHARLLGGLPVIFLFPVMIRKLLYQRKLQFCVVRNQKARVSEVGLVLLKGFETCCTLH